MTNPVEEMCAKLEAVLDKVNALIRSAAAIYRSEGQNYWLVPDTLKCEIEAALKGASHDRK